MKTFSLIISILLLLFTITRFAARCSKNESRNKANQFTAGRNLVEIKRREIFMYDRNGKDSLEWMQLHTKAFNTTLDSCITYYRNNYRADENRHDIYLKVLYEYKKLGYLYQSWINYNREIARSPKSKEEFSYKLRTFKSDERQIRFDMQRKSIELMMVD